MTLDGTKSAICGGVNVQCDSKGFKLKAKDMEQEGIPPTKIRTTEDGRLIENTCRSLEIGGGNCPYVRMSDGVAGMIAETLCGGGDGVGFEQVDQEGRAVFAALRSVGSDIVRVVYGADCPRRPSPEREKGFISHRPDLKVADEDVEDWYRDRKSVQG